MFSKAKIDLVFDRHQERICTNGIRIIGPFNLKSNTKLDSSYSFTETVTPTVYQCAQYCYYFKQCMSLNFNTKNNKCQLNALALTYSWLKQDERFVYMERQDVPKEIAGACANNACDKRTMCLEDGGKSSCFPIFKGKQCPPQELPAYVTTNVITYADIGTVAKITCRKPLVGKHWAICKEEGRWTRQTPGCFPDFCDSVHLIEPDYKSGVKYIGSSDKAYYNLPVYCDAQTDNGNWLVVQRRIDMLYDFNRTWDEYEKGFGDPTSDYWIGNEYLHLLTTRHNITLRVQFQVDGNETMFYAKYGQFRIGTREENYAINIGHFLGGNCGEDFPSSNGTQFMTWDYPGGEDTGKESGSGWWQALGRRGANLNAGTNSGKLSWHDALNDITLTGIQYTEMMIKRH